MNTARNNVLTPPRSCRISKTFSVPSSTKETAPTWIPIILEETVVSPRPGMARDAPATVAIFRNSRRFTSDVINSSGFYLSQLGVGIDLLRVPAHPQCQHRLHIKIGLPP